MKKIWTMFLVMLLICSMATPAFALGNGGSEAKDITIKVVNGLTTPDVYYVVVSWESLAFQYDLGGGENQWDAENHSYSMVGRNSEKWVDNTSNITVTNHSNVAVNISTLIDSNSKKELNNVTATLDKTSATIEEADQAAYMGMNKDKAPFAKFNITVSGTPSQSEFILGEVKVIVNP